MTIHNFREDFFRYSNYIVSEGPNLTYINNEEVQKTVVYGYLEKGFTATRVSKLLHKDYIG